MPAPRSQLRDETHLLDHLFMILPSLCEGCLHFHNAYVNFHRESIRGDEPVGCDPERDGHRHMLSEVFCLKQAQRTPTQLREATQA